MLLRTLASRIPYDSPELELKNRILTITDERLEQEEGSIRDLIEKINEFNHTYKRKPKKLRRSSCSYGRYDDEVKLHPPP